MIKNKEQLYKVRGNILLTGETGTGKSYLAKKIHRIVRGKERYCEIQLSSMSENLIESELFGHIKGSFTGACKDKVGFCQQVGEGTLFLDEIGELSLDIQKKLLQLLEERVFYAVGSCQPISFSGFIIAATNKNLSQLVEDGKFRQDLYYRLNVFSYQLPSINQRREDISKIVEIFLKKFNYKYEKDISFTAAAYNQFTTLNWPGNIREIRNVVERIVGISDQQELVSDITNFCDQEKNVKLESMEIANFPFDYHRSLEIFEKIYLSNCLNYFKGKINHTSRELGISKATLIAKIRKYGINTWQIKSDDYQEQMISVVSA